MCSDGRKFCISVIFALMFGLLICNVIRSIVSDKLWKDVHTYGVVLTAEKTKSFEF